MTRPGLLVAVTAVGGLMTVTAGAARAQSSLADDSVVAVRQADYSPDNPVHAIRGVWIEPPEPPVAAGQATYMVRLHTVPEVEGVSAPVLDWGVLDAATIPEPMTYSYCSGCYDSDVGFPPPAEGWRELAPHGFVRERTEFMLSFDPAARRWVWYVDEVPLRSSTGGLAGPAVRVTVGAVGQGGAALGEHKHLELQIRRSATGWETFEPMDSEWPAQYFDGVAARFEPPGVVRITPGTSEDSTPRRIVPLWRRGGPVLDIVATHSSLYASIGPSVVAIDAEGNGLPTRVPAMLTNSAVSALDVGTGESLWVATRNGELVEFDTHEQRALRRCPLGETASSLSVAGDHVAVGLWSGKALVIDRECRIVGEADAGAPIRCIESLSRTEWIVGTETLALGQNGGEVSRLSLEADQSVQLQGSTEVPGAVVAISVTQDNGSIWVTTARGHLVRFAPGNYGSLNPTGEYRVSGEPADALVFEPYLYVLGRSREVWALDLATGSAVDIQGKMAAADTVLARNGENLYGGSRSGAVEVSLFSPPTVQTEAVLWEVGAATSVAPSGLGLAVLSDYRTLQHVANQELRSVMLPQGAATLRPWTRGVAVVHGLGGVRIYEDDSSRPAQHIRVPGLTRDVVLVDGVTAFVAAGAAGVHSVDVSGAEPQLLATVAVQGLAASVSAIESDVLLVGQLGADILMVDVTQADHPSIVSAIDGTPDVARFARTDRGIVALGLNGVAHLLRAEDGRVELIRSLRLADDAHDLSLTDDATGYVATDAQGLVSVDIVQGTAEPVTLGLRAPSLSLCRQGTTWIAGLGPDGVVAWESHPRLYLPTVDSGK